MVANSPSRTAILLVLTAAVRAQQAPSQQEPVKPTYVAESLYTDSRIFDDFREHYLYGGFRFNAPHLGFDIRGNNAVIHWDLEQTQRALAQSQRGGLPRRDIEPPASRRRLSAEQVRRQVDRSMQALGQTGGLPQGSQVDTAIDLLRYLYCEGGVTVVQNGVLVLRCERLWISPLDDRIVVEDAELRYMTPGSTTSDMLIVRGKRLVKQGSRWTGRDVSITTCTAAEPHFSLDVGEAEIIERQGQFEVRSRGQTLKIGGTSVLPLPDAHIFTGEQTPFPIRSVRGGYSSTQGMEAGVTVGLPWNKTGGAVHNWLTGRPEHEFRGDTELSVDWIEERGVPLQADFDYSAGNLYRGRTKTFWLDDHGTDQREIDSNLDGSPIGEGSRGLFTTENRVRFGESIHLDVQAFSASDPGVYSEFFNSDYHTKELPETSLYLQHHDENRVFTVGTRFSLTDFSYRDDRALSDSFVEELPVITYDWFAQPIAELPWGSPLVVDLSTELGQRRRSYDDLSTIQVDDETFRADQVIEMSTPMQWGALNLRPYVKARGTWYDNTLAGDSQSRLAMEAGVQLGTRMSRTWSWLGDDSDTVRHVMAPRVWLADRFHVDEDASQFYQFDEVDSLTEETLVRVELRNLFQRMETADDGSSAPRDFLFVDLAQDIWPDKTRDNDGDTLGLFYYDLLVRPTARWLPFRNFSYAVYGDVDWRRGMRTFDTELRFGPLAGINWVLEYREDSLTKGAVGAGATTKLLDRWELYGGSQRDLNTDEWLNYRFGLRRADHDWMVGFDVVYNPFSDETTFRIDFQPRFGGGGAGRDRFSDGGLPRSSLATGY